MRHTLLLGFILNLTLSASGCAELTEAPSVELKGKRYTVELADTPELRERGLMFRRDMPAEVGMLFIHDSEEPLAYWMKNTYIPLDILYFDSKLRLVSAQLGVPPCGDQPRCPAFASAGPAQYVLELNAGQAAALDLNPGDRLSLKGVKPAR
ncbi:DUF192 domain-containing protein [Arenimonas sp.]|jgi:uncharacterized membrane protein (UPF0127 family)|uniref:DUF192 domain-containing protein n=1 Tax=Arenimonas sp. TaxID=1872635 RepID=UPI0037C11F0A